MEFIEFLSPENKRNSSKSTEQSTEFLITSAGFVTAFWPKLPTSPSGFSM